MWKTVFSWDGGKGRLSDDSSGLHLLCTFFLLLLHQLHLRSSGIRYWRQGTPALQNGQRRPQEDEPEASGEIEETLLQRPRLCASISAARKPRGAQPIKGPPAHLSPVIWSLLGPRGFPRLHLQWQQLWVGALSPGALTLR